MNCRLIRRLPNSRESLIEVHFVLQLLNLSCKLSLCDLALSIPVEKIPPCPNSALSLILPFSVRRGGELLENSLATLQFCS